MTTLKAARNIMKNDLLHPEEMLGAFRINPSQWQEYFDKLDDLPYSASQLDNLKGGHVLFPYLGNSLNWLQAAFPKEFCYKADSVGARYLKNEFATDRAPVQWYLFPKVALHMDIPGEWAVANARHASDQFRRPFIREIATMLLGYKLLRGIRLLEDTTVLCHEACDGPKKEYMISIGSYGASGIGIWQVEPVMIPRTDRLYVRVL